MKIFDLHCRSFSILLFIFICFLFHTTAFSALNSTMKISGDSFVRVDADVRITDFNIFDISDSVLSSYEEFNKESISTRVSLPYSDSYAMYRVEISNYGEEIVVSDIIGLPDNLNYELIDLELNRMICDEYSNCNFGISKTFYIKFFYNNYDSNIIDFDINLTFKFKNMSKTLMAGKDFSVSLPETAKSLLFVQEMIPDNTKYDDLSLEQDGGVVGWLEGETYKVSSQREGVKVLAPYDLSYMLSGQPESGVNGSCISTVDFNGLDTSNVTDMSYMFYDSIISSIIFGDINTSNVINMSGMFQYAYMLEEIDLSNFDTSDVVDMSNMFAGSGVIDLDLSSFETNNVTDMGGMFNETYALSSLDILSFDTSSVVSMSHMFAGTGVEKLNLSHFDTSNVVNMSGMFWGTSFSEIEGLDTSNVLDMSYMFSESIATSIDLSNFDTSSVTNMSYMFSGSFGLESVDISSFDTSSVTNMSYMFAHTFLSNIYVGMNWTTSNVTEDADMFYLSSLLPNYDENYVDKTYAYAGGDGLGYLTYKVITFTIYNVEYSAIRGMTWRDWCDSEYNIDGFFVTEVNKKASYVTGGDLWDEPFDSGKLYITVIANAWSNVTGTIIEKPTDKNSEYQTILASVYTRKSIQGELDMSICNPDDIIGDSYNTIYTSGANDIDTFIGYYYQTYWDD